MNEDQGAIVLIIIIVVGVFVFIIGYGRGTKHKFGDSAVITKVTTTDNGYSYETNQFTFKSDSLYSVGDTIHIGK